MFLFVVFPDNLGAQFHRNRLYIEPKKAYRNPLFSHFTVCCLKTPLTRKIEDTPSETAEKRSQLFSLIKILAQLSRKLLQPSSGKTAHKFHFYVLASPKISRDILVILANKTQMRVPASYDSLVVAVVKCIARMINLTNYEEFSLKSADGG